MHIYQKPDQGGLTGIDPNPNCGRDKSYVAIIISVVPLWAIITTLIVLALLMFHKYIKLTKIYDNCTKQNANFVYHIELRTGDTSATYNRRKTTLTIDMFDENQSTLARIAIPGHVIFGRKDEPVPYLDDDKFFELRVTRLWLYRSAKLRRVSTIRLTHSCMEPEARIMIYGVELRLGEHDKPKLFFPVMNYITPYGTANKINTCFDSDQFGSISALGGRFEAPLIGEYLTTIDYTVLIYHYCALLFFMSTFDMLGDSFKDSTRSVFKGAIIGCICFVITAVAALFLRFIIKWQYAVNVGSGLYAYLYHATNALIFSLASGFWAYATYKAYDELCSNDYSIWVLCLCVAAAEGFAFAVLVSLIFWLIGSTSSTSAEQFVVTADESPGSSLPASGVPEHESTAVGASNARTTEGAAKARQASSRAPVSTAVTASPSALMMPAMGGPSNITGMASWQPGAGGGGATTAPVQGIQPLPMMGPAPPPHGYPPYPMYMQQQPPPPLPQPMIPQQAGQGYKAPGYGSGPSYDTTAHYQQQPPGGGGGIRTIGNPSYHQQVTGTATTASGRTRQTRKTGSSESTGSTYYQQLMKNKGGVKSISQYGELMKQKKNKR